MKNHRGAFTRIWGGRQAFYDLGINLHTDLPAEDFEKNPKTALMTTPSLQILKALDSETSDQFMVGVDSDRDVQDPLAFEQDYKSETTSRPRGRVDMESKKTKKDIKGSFQDELEEIFSKTLNLLERKLGRKLFNETMEGFSDNDLDDDEASCDPEEIQKVQDKCEALIHDCMSPLLIDLDDREYVEMEGKSEIYHYWVVI